MTHSINTRNLISQSFEVNRIEQLRSATEQHQQHNIAIDQEKKHLDKQNQVNKTNQSEKKQIHSDEDSSRKNKEHKQRKKPKNEEKENMEEKFLDEERGHFIDFRV
ncbi:MAG: hypothetical protein KAX49_00695 [Halanaerobiales bacterium]|nr:hypothetical protein [Halanaerobiales bacterium]